MDKSLEMLLENMQSKMESMDEKIDVLLADKHEGKGQKALIRGAVASCWAVITTLLTLYFGSGK